jgi:hypothetical protein
MSIFSACFYVPVLKKWWLGEGIRQDNLAVHKADWPTWNLVRAKEFSRRTIKDWVVFKGKRESASVDLGKCVGINELEKGRTRIGAKDVDLVAGTLVKPGLRARQRGRGAGGDV